jgi:hypothetical protein
VDHRRRLLSALRAYDSRAAGGQRSAEEKNKGEMRLTHARVLESDRMELAREAGKGEIARLDRRSKTTRAGTRVVRSVAG